MLWKTGPEMVNVATSIVRLHGFGSPFGVDTGPTAWLPPVYPYLIAGVFRIAGVRSTGSALILLSLQAFFSAVTCVFVYAIAKRTFGEKIAALSAWAWALSPYAVVIPVLFLWETSLSALLLSVVAWLSLRPQKAWTDITAGVLWGVAALTNTALLSVLPLVVLWWLQGSSLRAVARRAGVLVIFSFLVVAPWLVRNWFTFHVVMPVRSNFAEQLWLGNHEGGSGRVGFGMNALENPRELDHYKRMGEIQYENERKREALQFIAHNPGQFVRWTLYRTAYWWFGIGERSPIFFLYGLLGALTLVGVFMAWRSGNPDARLILAATLVFPVVYYFTDVYARYRYPVEPLMIMLAAYACVTGIRSVRKSNVFQRSG